MFIKKSAIIDKTKEIGYDKVNIFLDISFRVN